MALSSVGVTMCANMQESATTAMYAFLAKQTKMVEKCQNFSEMTEMVETKKIRTCFSFGFF